MLSCFSMMSATSYEIIRPDKTVEMDIKSLVTNTTYIPPRPSHKTQHSVTTHRQEKCRCWLFYYNGGTSSHCLFKSVSSQERKLLFWCCTLYRLSDSDSDSDSESLTPTGSSYTLLLQAGLHWDHCRAGRGVIIYIVYCTLTLLSPTYHHLVWSGLVRPNTTNITSHLSSLFPASASSFLGQAGHELKVTTMIR